MMQNQSSYKLVHENCRRVFNCNEADEDCTDHAVPGIPKMELMNLDYLGRVRTRSNGVIIMPKTRMQLMSAYKIPDYRNKSKANDHADNEVRQETPKSKIDKLFQNSYNYPLKYAIYKKHNRSDLKKFEQLGLSDDDDGVKLKLDSAKRKNRVDNIQFYFDSKGYEKHVDNKIYGIIADKVTEENSKSWSFKKTWNRKIKTPDYKPVIKASQSKITSNNLSRINQIFSEARQETVKNDIDVTAGSLKKIKKLEDNFENRCSCDELKFALKHRTPSQMHLYEVPNHEKSTPARDFLHDSKKLDNENCNSFAPRKKSYAKQIHNVEDHVQRKYFEKKVDDDCCKFSIQKHVSSDSDYDSGHNESDYACKKISDDYPEPDYDTLKTKSHDKFSNLKNFISQKPYKELQAPLSQHKFSESNQNLNNSIKSKHVHKDDFNSKTIEKVSNTQVADRKSTYTSSKIPKPLAKTQSKSIETLDSDTSSSLTNQKSISKLFPSKLGCDGAIFWNDCYYYDEHTCCNCQSTQLDDSGCTAESYMCVCDIIQGDGINTRPHSMEGPMDSGISVSGDTISSPDSDISLQHQSDLEARRLKRGHVLAELLETERIYVSEMGSILKGYRDQMVSDDMASLVPPGLEGKEDVLFGNLNELYSFHNDIFLKDLENCISTTELVALCFVQRRDTFYRLYSYYCQNIPRSERLRETLVDTHLFLQECQKRLGHKLPLAAYLLKPVQRITKYQLLLKDLLRFTDSGTCAKELQKALDCMLIVLKCVNDSMHQIAITGFPADLTQQGELLLQDSFQVWTESKKDLRLRLKTQQRHIFLYQKAMLFCKQAAKTAHSKSTYQFKHHLKMSQIGLTESVRGDSRRFEVWLQGRQEVHTFQALTIEIKNKWVSEIKRVLLNQLEELKGEKIKQYGLPHRTLRQTVSWDVPMSGGSTPQRTKSCDTSEMNNRLSHISDEGQSGISTGEHENHEGGAWSSDYSNSEDEFTSHEDEVLPGTRYVSLADYCGVGHSEVSIKEGDTVELLKVGCAGWWFVKVLDFNVEGWAPAAYLEPINKTSFKINN
ncbi:uncharacterized protein LOC119081363 isoform X4 [Bradysia coprophila]|uniref:uncharacterized protein LOC119081363 isoform X4 n=1 Tax=Bradysia coprophila TaxID=38358 RepID=UPI00187DAB8D|nr:uncharacterized protein LOC119081363 isoform X4 [Bradysia coprophila]XP_037046124.1 uncharacterized protein LOC119081363 isoform X4 [Bradysia coprophila]